MNRSIRIAALTLMPALLAMAQQQPMRPANWLDPDKSTPAGTEYHTFQSKLAGGEVSYLVHLPATYQTEQAQRYASVYWLHGLNGDQRAGAAFVEQMTAAAKAGKAPHMIIVLVNGMRDSFYCDSKDGKWPIESVIVKELVPHIDKTYRTVARREFRLVEGYSMGGYGAAHLGFKYPDVFGLVGVMAGALITPSASVQPRVFEKMYGSDPAYVEANSPSTLVRKNAEAIRGRTAVRVAVGDQDGLQVQDKAFHGLLTELKIEHEFETVPGVAHNSALFYKTLGTGAFAWLQKAITNRPPDAGNWPNVSAQSHVFQRGDVEILTFETEKDYDKLQELYKQSKDIEPKPGEMTTLYYRTNTDNSVQPYAMRLPAGYSKDRKYPLVIQLHGTNFHEVLSGSRLNYRGMGGPQWIQPDLPVIYLHAFGGPTFFYIGMGEVEILRLIDEMKGRFSIEPDRVYIMGH